MWDHQSLDDREHVIQYIATLQYAVYHNIMLFFFNIFGFSICKLYYDHSVAWVFHFLVTINVNCMCHLCHQFFSFCFKDFLSLVKYLHPLVLTNFPNSLFDSDLQTLTWNNMEDASPFHKNSENTFWNLGAAILCWCHLQPELGQQLPESGGLVTTSNVYLFHITPIPIQQ